ncbi:MAG TPA: cytochrome c oxidase accessory protein CcoG [Pirellulaceae bacterium]|nr:cytochrome c oxidase accessory protein CcoG [Pirellulaceae bacterium]HMO92677.1 cytochrome c oxidase accessory protein CcoG [Pirellulaceae bacterium]HMP70575.1 cytochrome c oxidase accessory protein CcoG [Pirellulaceae bacterium]
MSNFTLQPEEHVLSTLEHDGSRRWLHPKLSKGRFLHRRRIVAWFLIAIFTLVPFIKVGGKPLILLDIPARQFTILGFTFLPTDTLLLAIFLVGLLLTIFLFTALFGRVWCGWACPQTVYMEFVFRPIERFFEGTAGRGGVAKKTAPWRSVGKYAAFFAVSFYLANTFLAYFVGVEELLKWVRQSPVQHPIPFLVMAFVTCAMIFDFCFFREQLCIIACPYGRFQSVLLDQNSLIVAYDEKRGEPRGKPSRRGNPLLPIVGDCVDCGNCVTTCPTGIDIRKGLQMECIHCTQCIDACNVVMKKLGREPNLIRFSSQARDRGGQGGLVRARTLVYPLMLLGIVAAFFTVLHNKKSFDVIILREPGIPFSIADDGSVRNMVRVKLTNRSDDTVTFTLTPLEPAGTTLHVHEAELLLQPRQTHEFHVGVLVDRSVFKSGKSQLMLRVENNKQDSRQIAYRLVGPF